MVRTYEGDHNNNYHKATKTYRRFLPDYWENWNMNGKAGNDTLIGGMLSDTLNGGTGSDYLRGGKGNDRYHVDSYSDVIVEYSGEGTDHVISKLVSFTLPSNVETLDLDEMNYGHMYGRGNSLNNKIYGTDSATHDLLYGNDGNDTLYGFNRDDLLYGGTGHDILYGGRGSDKLFGGSGNDVLVGTNYDTSYVNNEHDTLEGGSGADEFWIGAKSNNGYAMYEESNSFALITDFDASEGDRLKIDVLDRDDLQVYHNNTHGSSALVDSYVSYEGTTVAIVQDTYLTKHSSSFIG